MLVMLVFLFTSPATQSAPSSIARELQAYYSFRRSNAPSNWDPKRLQQQLDKFNEKPPETPSWEVAMKQLDSPVAAQRRSAAEHLLAVMDQCLKDEQSGKAPWRATPYWGESGENPARQLRESILDAADHAPAAPEFIPLIRWVLRNENQLKLQESAVGILGKIEGKEAEACRVELVSELHPNAFVVGAALDQLGQHKTPLPADRLNALCQNHRQVIRQRPIGGRSKARLTRS